MNKSLLAIVLAALSASVQADEAAIRKALAERYPQVSVNSVSPSPVVGIHEVWANGQLFYTDGQGDYLFLGTLVDTRSKTNLSQQRLAELRAVKFDSLPLDKAFTLVKGKGERKVAVFSDPDCPFCKRLEKELTQIDNLTVYVFLYPLAELHPKAVEVAKNVWCSPDRAKSWSDYMLDGKTPAVAEKCEHPLDAIAQLASQLGIGGTPAVIFANGKRVDGYMPAKQIEEMLKSGS